VFLVDSGATGCYVSTAFVGRHNFPTKERHQSTAVRLADGSVKTCTSSLQAPPMVIGKYEDSRWDFTILDLCGFDVVLGKVWLDALSPVPNWSANTLRLQHGGRDITLRAPKPSSPFISPEELHSILQHGGEEVCWVLAKVVEEISEGPVVADMTAVLDKFPSVTGGLPSTLPPLRAVNHAIPLIPGSRVPPGRIYQVSTQQEAELKTQLADLLKRGFIRNSTSPYGAPVLFVRKADGSSRMCQDFRGLNKISVKNSYPLPRIDSLLDRLHGATVFSKLDLQMGYNQIRIEPDDVEKSAFRTRYGLYEYLVMPFGMCNAPATFQRTMNDIFREHLDVFVLVYLDDILVFSKTAEEHHKHLTMVLAILQKHQFYCKLSKCQFGRSSMDFLGHHVGADGIHASASKHRALSEWPVPQSATDVRSFLGLANYIRRGVSHFSDLATPLLELTHMAHKWEWLPVHDKAFKTLKHACVNSSTIFAPNPEQPFIVTTDASAFATGAVLEQIFEGKRRIIAFDSKKFSPSELNKTAYEKEMLAVLHALRVWRHHLLGDRPFILNCDNSAVTYLSNQPQLSPQQARWQQFLSEYNYEIRHIPGKDNIAADALSRRRDHDSKSIPSQ